MFSSELISEFKKKMEFTRDAEVVAVLPAATKSIVSEIKSGKRPLTEEQALFIAHECGLCGDWVLVNLAEEKAKSEEAKEIWHNLAKKLTKSINATILVLSLVFCGFGDNQERNAVLS